MIHLPCDCVHPQLARAGFSILTTEDPGLILLNVLGPPFCTLTLGQTGSMRMIDEDEVGFKEKPGTYPQFAIIGTADLGKVQVRHT